MADFSAAFGAMRRGLKVRREGWTHHGLSISIQGDRLFWHSAKLGYSKFLSSLDAVDMLATDWEHIPE